MNNILEDYLIQINGDPEDWNLFELSLLICRMEDPQLPLAPYRRQVEKLAGSIGSKLSPDSDTYSVVNALNDVLFSEEGFAGNRENYYDPANSFMSQVLETKRGIPITLSILYKEIASCLGIPLDYVGMPGHFLLRLKMPLGPVFIDSFNQGQMLLPDDCSRRMGEIYADRLEFRMEFLRVTPNREVLLRLLANLKQIYRNKGDSQRLLQVLERRIPLLADPLSEILERGLLRINLEDYPGALSDLEEFVEKSPNPRMKALVKAQLERLRCLAAGH